MTTGRILKSFDVGASKLGSASFPYTVVATRDGRRAWVVCGMLLWYFEMNITAESFVELPLQKPKEAIAPGSPPYGSSAESRRKAAVRGAVNSQPRGGSGHGDRKAHSFS